MNGTELLPSWSEGDAKRAVLEFVESVSRPGASYVPPANRIATFDNDGTLWCEKPQYVQADFVFRRWKQMAQADPAKAKEQPYKAVVENDQAWLTNWSPMCWPMVDARGENKVKSMPRSRMSRNWLASTVWRRVSSLISG